MMVYITGIIGVVFSIFLVNFALYTEKDIYALIGIVMMLWAIEVALIANYTRKDE